LNTTEAVFIAHSARKLEQLSGRIVTCLGKLSVDQIWLRGGEHENAIGNLVLHLCGNVRQWIGMGVGGQPDIRTRDAEFAARSGEGPAELAARLTAVVSEALDIIGTLPAPDLMRVAKVQGYEITVLEAVAHVVEHFAQHTGQIILLTKHATGEDLGFYAHLSRPRHSETTP
jgi:uncharacterized damage-inducible protein DinB